MSKFSPGDPAQPRASRAQDAASRERHAEAALEEAASELWALHGYGEEELVERVRKVIAYERDDRGRLRGRGR